MVDTGRLVMAPNCIELGVTPDGAVALELEYYGDVAIAAAGLRVTLEFSPAHARELAEALLAKAGLADQYGFGGMRAAGATRYNS